MNKTNILSFIIDEVALKARNVSKNMRKRIHWMLKEKEITVKQYDERAVTLNNSIRVGKTWAPKVGAPYMKKGISNYRLENQEELDRLIELNKEVRCNEIEFNLTGPVEFEFVENLSIDEDNCEAYSKCSFSAVKDLKLKNLSTDQAKFILTKFKSISDLMIRDSSLESIDLRELKIKDISFRNMSLKGPVYLPSQINQFYLNRCESANLIKAQRVNQINFSSGICNYEECNELLKTLKGVKAAKINQLAIKYVTSLPSTVRKLESTGPLQETDQIEEIINYFPNLIEILPLAPIERFNKTKVRSIHPTVSPAEEKFKLRPRKIQVDSKNAVELSKHPELFERVEHITLTSNQFNFDVLTKEMKKIEISYTVDQESTVLNRFEKERD